MERRELLRMSGAAGAFALAGCVADDPDGRPAESGDGSDPDDEQTPDPEDGESEDGPIAAVEAFFEAFETGDAAEINAHIHDDGEVPAFSEEEAADLTDWAYTPTAVEVVDETEDEATVEFVLEIEPPDEENVTVPQQLTLRRSDEEWRIWDLEEGGSDRVPEVSFEVDRVDGDLEIVHSAGDHVEASAIAIRGEGLAATGTWEELGGTVDDDGTITAGNALTVAAEDSYELSIVWEDPESDMTVTLQAMAAAVEEATDGEPVPPAVEEHLEDVDNFHGAVVDQTGEDEVTVLVGDVGNYDQVYVFDYPAIRVDPGTTVTWEIVEDGSAHSVTAEDETFDSGVFDEGTWSYTFEEPGTYAYHCAPHEALGQKGAVVVADPEAED